MAKILYAASTASHIESFHIPYIEALRADGHTVLTMACGEGVDYNIPFSKKLFSIKNAKARKSVKAILKSVDFDAVVLNTSLAAFHIRLAMKKTSRPRVVNIVHGYLFKRRDMAPRALILRLCERIVRKKTDKIIVMNREDRKIAEELRLSLFGVSEIRGMGAALRPGISSPDELSRQYSLDGKYVITFVGELSERKNQHFLISMLPRIKSAIPNAVLCLVGDGKEREGLSRLSERMSVSDSVIFTGHRKEACDLIRLCDLYVSASLCEGLPFNIVEALGAGKAIIATDIKGHADLLSGGAGFLYECGDAGGFLNLVTGIYEKRISPDKSKIDSVYRDYSFEQVFPDTLSKIKEAIFGECSKE